MRKAAVAGRFYPNNKNVLLQELEKYCLDSHLNKKPLALIVPHAGYSCSGPIAGKAYASLSSYQYDNVIVLSACHSEYMREIIAYDGEGFDSPLGPLFIDDVLRKLLLEKVPILNAGKKGHLKDHTIEVQVPFIQNCLPNTPFVPIMLGHISFAQMQQMGESLAETVNPEKTLLIISSDLSHFPSYENACQADQETISLIEKAKIKDLYEREELCRQGQFFGIETFACATSAICVLLYYLKKIKKVNLHNLGYLNSADTCGDKSSVVGYTAMAAY